MDLILGVDAGGTFTDAVLLDQEGRVISFAKAPTTPADLALGIAKAVDALPSIDVGRVRMVCLSTTLATNAVIEGRGGAVGLILIGYDHALLQENHLPECLPVVKTVCVNGGHDSKGEEISPLDEAAVRKAVLEIAPSVEAFAVSGYFSVMNPQHELRVRDLIEHSSSLPVVCGHELTSQLNAVKRVTTVVMNARLLSLIRLLLDAVKIALAQRAIEACLMVVRGDGSLMDEGTARHRPIDAVLSGPAASAIGAHHLSGIFDAVVLDMGGTSTDIAVLQNGRPWTTAVGAKVGGWRLSVEAVDVCSIGLGGDSMIHIADGRLTLLPMRAIPLCRLAETFPFVLSDLQKFCFNGAFEGPMPEYIVLEGKPEAAGLPLAAKALAHRLAQTPVLKEGVQLEGQDSIEEAGIVRCGALTPTDLFWQMGAGGSQDTANAAADAAASVLKCTRKELQRRVMRRICRRLEHAVIGKLTTEGAVEQRLPLVGIGAPAGRFIPLLAQRMHFDHHIPPFAAVGSAVGAAVASISRTVEVRIQPYVQGGGTPVYLVHGPGGRERYTSFSKALARSENLAEDAARHAVASSGSGPVTVLLNRREIPMGESVEVTIRAFASGRPKLFREPGGGETSVAN